MSAVPRLSCDLCSALLALITVAGPIPVGFVQNVSQGPDGKSTITIRDLIGQRKKYVAKLLVLCLNSDIGLEYRPYESSFSKAVLSLGVIFRYSSS